MAYPRIKLSDNSGNEVAVTSNALDVNIAGMPHVQKHAYYNPGNSAVTESM